MVEIYGLDDGIRIWRQKASILAADPLAAHAVDVDAHARFPVESMAALAQQGFYGLCVDARDGGQGQGPGAFAAVVEEFGQQCGSTAMIFVMHVAAAKVIEAATPFPHRDDVLRAICAGQHLTTFAVSERGSRSQFWAPVSKLETQGNGYQTNALKSWVTAAHHADSYVAGAQSPGAQSPMASSLYLIPRTRQGVRFTDAFDGLGLRGNDSSPVSFEQVNLTAEDFLTAHGKGMEGLLQVGFPWFAVATSAMAHGLCLAALDATSRHLQNTGFEHTGTGLRDLPNLRARLAEMSVATEQSRALLGHTMREMSAPDETTPLWVLRARMSALQTAVHVTDLAMKACGGAAFSRHLSIERMFRDARAGWVMAPTVDHLADFLGRAMTGLPLF